MFDRFLANVAQMIQQALRPYDDQHAAVLARIEELERRVRNQIQPARVIAIEDSGQRVQVQYGRNTSPYLRWFTPAAGAIKEYRCPSVDEQCALINYGGGDNSTQAWVLCGIWSDQYPAPTGQTHLHLTEYPDGSVVEHNGQTGDHTLKISGDLILDIQGRIIETATQHLASKR